MPKYNADFLIKNNIITFKDGSNLPLKDGQYFRIIDSSLNDGVHKYPANDLIDEEFTGEIWEMSIPPVVEDLEEKISLWQDKYGGIASTALSPFNSESFGGYSYSKSQSSGSNGGSANSWQSTFSDALSPWRKI